VAAIEPAAAIAAALLARGSLAAGEDSSLPGLAALVDTRLPDHPDLQGALQQARTRPEDPATISALAQALVALGKADPAFGSELVGLVAQAQQAPQMAGLVTNVSGQAQVSKLVNIAVAGRVNVYAMPAPPQTVLDQLPPARPGLVASNLPGRNQVFTGRAELLARLYEQLTAGTLGAVAVTPLPVDSPAPNVAAETDASPQVLHGLGGVGKTQLALEYAHRHEADYAIRWWVTAEQPATIPVQLAGLAHRLGVPEQPNQAETVSLLLDELGRRGRWLLIFDNAEDPSQLHPYWPSTQHGGHLLVTSRNPHWQPLAAPIPVDVLPREEAIAFIERRIGLDEHDANALAESLGDLPLALEQAAAYLEQTHTPPGDYLKLLATRSRELFALGRSPASEQTIATVWSVSLSRLSIEAPIAKELLQLCAFLDPEDIPRTLLEDYPDKLPEPLASAVQDRLSYQQALGGLSRYSMAAVTTEAVRVHRLVQAVVRQSLAEKEQRRWARAAVRLVLAAFPERPDEVAAWPAAARLLPHALAVTTHASTLDVGFSETATLLNQAAGYVYSRADYADAKVMEEQALKILEARPFLDHPAAVGVLDNLGNALSQLGDYEAARAYHERAVAAAEAKLGPNHPGVAFVLNNLGATLHRLGRHDAARKVLERALATHRAHLGPDDPLVAGSLSSLGVVLSELGDLAGARRALEEALAIFEAGLGHDHPDVAFTANNLGAVLKALGQLDAARKAYERALAVSEAQLGPNHPEVAQSLLNLGGLLADKGDLERAREVYERAISILEERLGPKHPDLALALNNFGLILRQVHDIEGARGAFERAVAIREALFGASDPNLATSLNDLGASLVDFDEFDAARKAFERALAIQETALGSNHPYTVRSRQNLAAVTAELSKRQ
jgi:tetratricopeptide (TPR) repeat protein